MVVTALSLTSSRIENAMYNQASDLIGGDKVITNTTDFPDAQIKLTENHDLNYSKSVTTSTMVSANDEFQLSRVRAVDNNYPLKGALTVKDNLDSEPYLLTSRPKSGNAWIEARLFEQLNLKLGDQIDVGFKSFTVSKVIELEPDQGGGFYSFYPKVLINYDDIDATKLIQPGSRLRFKLMVASENVNDLSNLNAWLSDITPTLTASQRVLDPKTTENQLTQNLERASAFINLGSLMSIILCGIAIALASSRYARRQVSQVALLRCLGLRSKHVNIIYIMQLLFITLISIVVGVAIGFVLQLSLISILSEFFSGNLPPPSFVSWLSGPISAIFMVIGFGLPPIIKLSQTPPARVLRKESSEKSGAHVYPTIVAIIALTCIAWWQTGNFSLSLMAIAGTLFIVSILMGLIILLMKSVSKNSIKNVNLRSAYSNLLSRPLLTSMQVVGFGLSVFAIVLILFFRIDLFNQWNQEIPDNAPNKFAFDIQSYDKERFEETLASNDITTDIYPVVRGRLIKINGKTVQSAVTKENEVTEEALNRDLALTEVDKLPFENEIIDGEFITEFSGSTAEGPIVYTPVSVEEELAKNLNLQLNDTLEFIAEGKSIYAKITSVRSVNWENFRPNFYFIFPKSTLDNFSQTWLTSFYLPKEDKAFFNKLSKSFIGTTIIDVDYLIQRIRHILNQVASAMELIFFMTVFASIAVFWAALLVSFDEKQYQSALLRALGASNRLITQRIILEQAIIGFLASLLCVVALAIVSWYVSENVLNINWSLSWKYWLIMPISLIVTLCALSTLQLNKILKTSPLSILRQERK